MQEEVSLNAEAALANLRKKHNDAMAELTEQLDIAQKGRVKLVPINIIALRLIKTSRVPQKKNRIFSINFANDKQKFRIEKEKNSLQREFDDLQDQYDLEAKQRQNLEKLIKQVKFKINF